MEKKEVAVEVAVEETEEISLADEAVTEEIAVAEVELEEEMAE